MSIFKKKHGEKTDNPSIKIYVNKIENRITFKIKTGHYLELFTAETMKLFGSTKSKINKDENGENVPHLKIAILSKMIINMIQESYTHLFLINQLLDISPKKFIFLKTFSSEFSYIEVWFTDQNYKPLEIVDKINITLVID